MSRTGQLVTWKPVLLSRPLDAHCPHQGHQFLLESTRQASTPEHFGNRYSEPLLPFLLTPGRMGQTPRARARSPLPSHAHYAGSASQPRVDIGWRNRPARAGKKAVRLETYCAGVILSAALQLVPRQRALRMRSATHALCGDQGPASGFPSFRDLVALY